MKRRGGWFNKTGDLKISSGQESTKTSNQNDSYYSHIKDPSSSKEEMLTFISSATKQKRKKRVDGTCLNFKMVFHLS